MGAGELIFISAMMVLILIISFAAVYLFFKTYNKERSPKDTVRNDPRSSIENPEPPNAPSKNS